MTMRLLEPQPEPEPEEAPEKGKKGKNGNKGKKGNKGGYGAEGAAIDAGQPLLALAQFERQVAKEISENVPTGLASALSDFKHAQAQKEQIAGSREHQERTRSSAVGARGSSIV